MEYDVVDKAEKVIGQIDKKEKITASQIRKFLTAVNVVKNKVDATELQLRNNEYLPDKLAGEIKFLRVNLAYQSGRDEKFKKFVKEAELDHIINDIGCSKEKFYQFCKYVEALVAFHKFFERKDLL